MVITQWSTSVAGFTTRLGQFSAARYRAILTLPAGVLAAQGVLSRALYLLTEYNRPYATLAIQLPQLNDVLLIILWLGLAPHFVYSIWTKRQPIREQGILVILLALALFVPAYPRYGRFHVSGALPFVALMSAGAVYYIARMKPSRWLAWNRLYGSVALLAIIVIGAALPTYYRIKLGPITSQYAALIPVSEWVERETQAEPGTRIWILPDIDPTGNFYPISGYQPPAFYTYTYPQFFPWDDVVERVIAGLESDPPPYVVVIDQWRPQITEALWNYVAQYYTVSAETDFSGELGHVTLYRRAA